MASLFVIRGRDQGKHFQLDADSVRLGRDASNQIQLLDHEASRIHAEIIRDGSTRRFELVDLDSSNGTLLNGSPIQRQSLHNGDRIEIGATILIFTGSSGVTASEIAHGVDILLPSVDVDASRIVSSLSGFTPPPSGEREGSTAAFLKSPITRASGLDADRSLEVMYRTAIAVGRTDDLDELLQRVLKLVFDWIEADRGCIMLRDPETKRMTPAARCDRDEEGQANQNSGRIAISSTILEYVLSKREGVRTTDALGDDRFDSAASIVQGGVREAICVPLQGRYDIVGALYVDTYTSPGDLMRTGVAQQFNDDHLRLITAIGHQAALAIEDTFYYSALLQGERLAAMGQTIATLSHHIKNILQGVRGGSYLIEAGLQRGDNDAIRKGWAIVDRNQERISNLVLDMLTFSKDRQPHRVEADLNDTVADVVELMQSRAAENGITLQSRLAPSQPPASFDPEAIHQAVLNLVTNAIDAAKSRVTVLTSYESQTGWLIDVQDDGEGIAVEDREQVFSLFESSKGSRGTGLGLAVTAKIVREHGGEIRVDDAPGGGAWFRIELPAYGTGTSAIPG